jgi:hypothetical protein
MGGEGERRDTGGRGSERKGEERTEREMEPKCPLAYNQLATNYGHMSYNGLCTPSSSLIIRGEGGGGRKMGEE